MSTPAPFHQMQINANDQVDSKWKNNVFVFLKFETERREKGTPDYVLYFICFDFSTNIRCVFFFVVIFIFTWFVLWMTMAVECVCRNDSACVFYSLYFNRIRELLSTINCIQKMFVCTEAEILSFVILKY